MKRSLLVLLFFVMACGSDRGSQTDDNDVESDVAADVSDAGDDADLDTASDSSDDTDVDNDVTVDVADTSDSSPDVAPDVIEDTDDTDTSADTVEDPVTDTETDAPIDADPDVPGPTTGSVTLYAEHVQGEMDTVLVSNGVPFARGVLSADDAIRLMDGTVELPVYTEVLARWQDDSVRSLLVQFNHDRGTLPNELTLEWGIAPTQQAPAAVTVDWDLPEAVAFPDAAYLTATGFMGPLTPAGGDAQFAAYDANQAAGYTDLVGSADWGPDARVDGYYSTTLNWYLHFARTGDVDVFEWARRESVHYRDDQIIQTGPDAGRMNGRTEPRYLFLRAMEADYLLTGDPHTLEVAELMARYLLTVIDEDWYFFGADDERFWTERRVAFPLLGLIVYGRLTGDAEFLDATHARLNNILATQNEHEDGGFIHHLYAHDTDECGTFGEYGGSPFMTGLLFEALIAYYDWFEDPRIVDSIVAASDWLYEDGWYTDGFSYMIGCGYGADDVAPDLNLLTAQGFGFAYWATGDERHRTRGLEVFNAGVTEAYLGSRKHFNQNYRSSGSFLWYLTR